MLVAADTAAAPRSSKCCAPSVCENLAGTPPKRRASYTEVDVESGQSRLPIRWESMSGLAVRRSEPEPGAIAIPELDLSSFLPGSLRFESIDQTEIPRLARDSAAMRLLEQSLLQIPTSHYLVHGDAREMRSLAPESTHLVLTSPPYWTLKKYDEADLIYCPVPSSDVVLIS